MKSISYTPAALKDLKRHGNMAARIRAALTGYAKGDGAHANKVTQLLGSSAKRLRVGAFRIIFEETQESLVVTKIGPRGDVYE